MPRAIQNLTIQLVFVKYHCIKQCTLKSATPFVANVSVLLQILGGGCAVVVLTTAKESFKSGAKRSALPFAVSPSAVLDSFVCQQTLVCQ
jgi:hypothetical protein